MNSMKNRDRILEAIDQLRRRKARPDIQRICNYLFRRFSINSAEARNDLQWCVENDIVLKVEYKGNISYRNAAKKFSHMKRNNNNNNNTNNNTNNNNNNNNNENIDDITDNNNKVNRKFTQLLTNAFGELIVQEPDYLEYGVPIDEIINNILSKDSVRYTRKYISILIEKEVDNGNLIKMENNNLLMGPNKDDSNGNYNNKNNNAPTIIHQQQQQQEDEIIDISNKTPITSPNNSNDNDIDTVNLLLNKQKKKPGPKPGVKKPNSMEKFNENLQENDEKRNDNNGNVRVGVRRKRAKKVFDPSDNHIPKKRGRPAGSLNRSTIEKQLAKLSDAESRPESRSSLNGSNGSRGEQQGGVCSVCHLQYNKKGGTNEKMIACRECSNKAHYSCLNGDDMMLRMYPDNTWQCPHCKTCVVCYETSDAGCLVVCSVCADAYHTMCHQPRIHDKIKTTTKWLCINCEMPEELKIHEIQPNLNATTNIEINDHHHHHQQQPPSPSISGNTSSSSSSSSSSYQSPPLSPTTPPPQLSPQNDGHLIKEESGAISDTQSIKDWDDDNNIDPTIPDASNWTYEEVYQYFAQYFPEEAHIFRDQEIDGRSLLLLKRIDVLTNLNLKLGPALKIYRHVVKLQVRRDDPKLYWL